MQSADDKKKPDTVIIKKYANRRLYNTETSVYVTLDDLSEMVKQGRNFMVQDAKTGQDLTRQTLAQIIFERETKGGPLLPTEFLRSVIGFYDDSMRDVFQHYLTASMGTFMQNQEKMRGLMGRTLGEFSPLTQFEELTRQNVAFFEKAFSMFTPFGGIFNADEKKEEEKPGTKKR